MRALVCAEARNWLVIALAFQPPRRALLQWRPNTGCLLAPRRLAMSPRGASVGRRCDHAQRGVETAHEESPTPRPGELRARNARFGELGQGSDAISVDADDQRTDVSQGSTSSSYCHAVVHGILPSNPSSVEADIIASNAPLGNECLPNRCSRPSVRAVNRGNLLRVQLLGDLLQRHPLPEHRVDLLPPDVVTLVADPCASRTLSGVR